MATRTGRVAPPPDYTFLYDDRQIRIGRFIEGDKEYLYFEKKLTYQTVQVGMVALAVSQQKILETVASAKRYIFFLTLIIILFGVVMSLLVSLYFSSPIRRLQEGTSAIQSGDFDHRVANPRHHLALNPCDRSTFARSYSSFLTAVWQTVSNTRLT